MNAQAQMIPMEAQTIFKRYFNKYFIEICLFVMLLGIVDNTSRLILTCSIFGWMQLWHTVGKQFQSSLKFVFIMVLWCIGIMGSQDVKSAGLDRVLHIGESYMDQGFNITSEQYFNDSIYFSKYELKYNESVKNESFSLDLVVYEKCSQYDLVINESKLGEYGLIRYQ